MKRKEGRFLTRLSILPRFSNGLGNIWARGSISSFEKKIDCKSLRGTAEGKERQLIGLYNTLLTKEKAADKKKTGDNTDQCPKNCTKQSPNPKVQYKKKTAQYFLTLLMRFDITNGHCQPSSQL
jgi:hypothetical protein